MDARAAALERAEAGLTWQYPCLIWMADYLRDETGRDPAADWRSIDWTEATAKRELAKLAIAAHGDNAVARALDAIARRDGWIETDVPMQGAIMVGVLTIGDEGAPAIFDGQSKWISSVTGRGWTITGHHPERMWEIPRG